MGKTIYSKEAREKARENANKMWAKEGHREKISKILKDKFPARCPVCDEVDPIKFYYSKRNTRSNSYCKECHKQRCRDRHFAKSVMERRSTVAAYKYNITKEDYVLMYNNQDGKCAICKSEPKQKRGLHVDHCHVTKKVRGLLCHGCNTGIGSLQEDINILTNAINYLRN